MLNWHKNCYVSAKVNCSHRDTDLCSQFKVFCICSMLSHWHKALNATDYDCLKKELGKKKVLKQWLYIVLYVIDNSKVICW